MKEALIDGFMELTEKYGLETASIIALLVFHYWLIFWLIRQVIKSKDKEIDRLVENRNELQAVLMGNTNRLSSARKKK